MLPFLCKVCGTDQPVVSCTNDDRVISIQLLSPTINQLISWESLVIGLLQNDLAYTLETAVWDLQTPGLSKQAYGGFLVDPYFHFVTGPDFTRDINHTHHTTPACGRS